MMLDSQIPSRCRVNLLGLCVWLCSYRISQVYSVSPKFEFLAILCKEIPTVGAYSNQEEYIVNEGAGLVTIPPFLKGSQSTWISH